MTSHPLHRIDPNKLIGTVYRYIPPTTPRRHGDGSRGIVHLSNAYSVCGMYPSDVPWIPVTCEVSFGGNEARVRVDSRVASELQWHT